MRLTRLDSPGARHHVMNRGARHEPILATDDAKHMFLELLADLPQRFGIRVHGYVLMPNHYHLMLETVTGELPRAMRHLGGEFARRLNTELHWDGPVCKGRYRNRIVGTDSYWRHLLAYLHLGWRYWFNIPFRGIVLALMLYASALIAPALAVVMH
mgnify:CR=1 FL=1